MRTPAWQPSARQALLLDATIGPVASTATAFAAWRRALDINAIDEGSLRLLPLLVPRAHLLDATDPAWNVIRGCYRRAFYRGQLLGQRAATAATLFARAGIATMLLKGGALLPYYGGAAALRPMNDFDVLVPSKHAVRAIRLLLEHGWRAKLPRAEALPRAYHGACFTSPDGFDLDLHWQPLPGAEPADEAAIWDASAPSLLQGVATRVPCAADLLVIVCAHGAQWSATSGVRWVADALHILQSVDSNGFDWERVLASARRWHVTLALGDTLGHLAMRWQANVPPPLLRGLACAPVAAVDLRAYRVLSTRPGFGAYLARPWRRYRVRARQGSAWSALPGFVDYLQVTLGRAHARELPMEILRRIARQARGHKGGSTD